MEKVLFNWMMPLKTKNLLDRISKTRGITKSSILNRLSNNFITEELKQIEEDEKLLSKFVSTPEVKTTRTNKRRINRPSDGPSGYIQSDNGTWVLASEYESEEEFFL